MKTESVLWRQGSVTTGSFWSLYSTPSLGESLTKTILRRKANPYERTNETLKTGKLDRISQNAVATATSLNVLHHQSDTLATTTQNGFDTTHTQLAQVMDHLNKVTAQLSILELHSARLTPESIKSAPRLNTSERRVRAIQQATLQYSRQGALHTDMITIDVPGLGSLSPTRQVLYVQQLVFFRLLIWLLQHSAISGELGRQMVHNEESHICRHARLSFVWRLTTSLLEPRASFGWSSSLGSEPSTGPTL